jgi:hypothetical protein
MDIQLALKNNDDDGNEQTSTMSAAVTMICAGLPVSPAAPTLLLRSLDILLLEWEPPTDTGGSPILGYSVYMRASGDVDYEHIYNGTENPATRTLAITEFKG